MIYCGKRLACSATRESGQDAPDGPRAGMIVVRYGKMGRIGEFESGPDQTFTCGGMLVIATERGIELGRHVSLCGCDCERAIAPEKIRGYTDASSGGDIFRFRDGRILREASEADIAEFRHIEGTAPEKLDICRQAAVQFGLNMKIVECEQILGGERIVFYFMAEERVDFRQLVRQLASEFQTRIEMRQIGARDEARLLADYETCGRECCCRNFLKNLKPVGMAMAKLQKTTLDVAKVSGRCGRLKCCLRYEHQTYEELDRNLPRNGMWVSTSQGVGRVVDRQILTQLVKIRTPEGRVLAIAVEDIQERNVPPPPLPEEQDSGGPDAPRGGPRRSRMRDRPEPAARKPAMPADTEPEPPAQTVGGEDSDPQALPDEPAAALEDDPPPATNEGGTAPLPPRRRRRGGRARRGGRGGGRAQD